MLITFRPEALIEMRLSERHYAELGIQGDFEDFIVTSPKYMHEYGHYIDSQVYGLSYLMVVALPSGWSALWDDGVGIRKDKDGKYISNPNSLSKHDIRKYELRANKNAKDYFEKYYGVDWSNYPEYPTEIPW